ncbi:hypothetical protein TSUD_238160 [Trifolium subterraneum]|uniref:RNase H type-1 domain-containing protein n=1 Tax=Trifolium subterraneum TaxID=3900 RepID=A0A2Z6NKW7_TRISU|nr:hypothetical protein TSUD_238160 [Trifolium subterraneum]
MTDEVGRQRGGRESRAHSSARREDTLGPSKRKVVVASTSGAQLQDREAEHPEPQPVAEEQAQEDVEAQLDDHEDEEEQIDEVDPPPAPKQTKRNRRTTTARNPPKVAEPQVTEFGGGPSYRICCPQLLSKATPFYFNRGCLPTRCRLLERRVECNLNCPVCDVEIEDELHIFFRCAVARDSWCAASLSSVLHNAAYQQSNAMDRIFAMCSNESSDTVGRVAMLLWSIWHNLHKLQSNSVSGTTEARWEKPALGWVKCNVDVAFLSGSGRTSVGVCFRDNSGQFMVGMTQWQQTVISPVEGEVWALLLAMEEARHRGLDRVQFESDSKVLIEAIHMKRRGNSEFLSIVHDILSFMSSFSNFEVKFIRRQANSVAHSLARAANSWSSFHRFEIILLCIEHLIVNEMQ